MTQSAAIETVEMKITFPGNRKVNAEIEGYTIATDQPREAGGDGSAPAPFDLFLASIGTCAGIYALSFCQKRNLPTEGLGLRQIMEWDETKKLYTKIRIEIQVPHGFPEQYRESLINAANLCAVKKHIATPPQFEVVTVAN